jgi:hypothetical protein
MRAALIFALPGELYHAIWKTAGRTTSTRKENTACFGSGH